MATTMATILLILMAVMFFVVVGLIMYAVGIYNGLVSVKNNIIKSFANIDVLLKQRSDELPKLINTVKGYMAHESGTLTKLVEARTRFLNANTVGEKAAADNIMQGALKSLFAVSENYPNLKSDSTFLQLQSRISELEDQIADRREFYNDSVNNYNIRIASIPDVFIARIMGLKDQEMFKVSEVDRQDVEVKF
jgi:LemA protein